MSRNHSSEFIPNDPPEATKSLAPALRDLSFAEVNAREVSPFAIRELVTECLRAFHSAQDYCLPHVGIMSALIVSYWTAALIRLARASHIFSLSNSVANSRT